MNKYYTGALKSPKDLRNYRIAKIGETIELPNEFYLAHSHIKDQGKVGSCVAHSLSSVLETNDNVNYSTGWIYGYRPADYYQGEGMLPAQALKTIKKIGYIPNENLDVNVEVPEAIEVVNKNLDKYTEMASKKKIGSYAFLNNFEEIKQALYLYKVPVIVCIDIDKNGLKLDENYVAYVPNQPYGGHAVMCYGWNEQGLLIQNSWGENWGNKGTFILPYSYEFYEAWAIDFKPHEEQENPIEKPNLYWLRELIMWFVKLIRKWLNNEFK